MNDNPYSHYFDILENCFQNSSSINFTEVDSKYQCKCGVMLESQTCGACNDGPHCYHCCPCNSIDRA